MTGNYVTMQNKWFIAPENQHPLIHIYNEKGFALLFRLLQTKTYRNQYMFNHYHLQEWFNIPKPSKTKSLMQLVHTFADDKILTLSTECNLKDSIYKGNIIFNINNNVDDIAYFKIYDYEAERILTEYQGNEDKYKLFSLFGCLKSHYNLSTKVCYPSIKRISQETKLIEDTILKYITILRELNLILYDNLGTIFYKKAKQQEAKNIYTMNYDGNELVLKDYLSNYMNELTRDDNILEIKKITSQKRSLSMQIEQLRRKLDRNEITESEFNLSKKPIEDEHERISILQDTFRAKID